MPPAARAPCSGTRPRTLGTRGLGGSRGAYIGSPQYADPAGALGPLAQLHRVAHILLKHVECAGNVSRRTGDESQLSKAEATAELEALRGAPLQRISHVHLATHGRKIHNASLNLLRSKGFFVEYHLPAHDTYFKMNDGYIHAFK